ncbi:MULTISPECIES: acyl-CoA thioesterase [Agarivorans]|jgi:acyl-CoA hydrolase|uniref:Acyl-CoA thioesterase n=1 Tax=Agarivorans aestuarii TaxID=1563703 RepID=A0ABU7G7F2_9ALTE|nr:MULTISPECIES: acyl-CoA thioesterase [Agarivorans]MEE1675344.1 acyl-CoA thioesterase [Agarivorans aestuarii]
MDKSQTEMNILVTPEMANFSGKMHGGAMLKKLDEVAYTTAIQYCGNYAVTLSVDQVLFKNPVEIGEFVTFLASVNYTGRTSMEIGIKVVAKNLKEQTVRHTHSCFFTMVAVDEQGNSAEVPPLQPSTEVAKRRFNDALRRRQRRMEKA